MDEMRIVRGIPQGGSSNDAVAIAMKENQLGIWAMTVRINCSFAVKFVHEVCSDLALLDQIRAGDRPFRVIPYSVDCRQLLEGFLLLMQELPRAFRKRKCSLTVCEWPELIGQGSACRGEIHLGDVDHQINRACATNPGLVVEPPAAGDNDVVVLVPRAERRAFGLGLETIPFQHFTERNVAHLVGEYGDFHPLIGHPIERRTSLKVALTSSGEGQSDNAAGSPNSSSLEAFSFAGGSSGVKPSLVWCPTSSA